MNLTNPMSPMSPTTPSRRRAFAAPSCRRSGAAKLSLSYESYVSSEPSNLSEPYEFDESCESQRVCYANLPLERCREAATRLRSGLAELVAGGVDLGTGSV